MYEFTESQIKDLDYFSGNVQGFMNDDNLRFKHLIISGEKIVKSFDDIGKAAEYAATHLKKGEYIIEQVVDENEIVNFV